MLVCGIGSMPWWGMTVCGPKFPTTGGPSCGFWKSLHLRLIAGVTSQLLSPNSARFWPNLSLTKMSERAFSASSYIRCD